jgi:hypothetical protein
MCPRAPDATTQTSGAPAPARPDRSLRRAPHVLASLRNPVAHATSIPDATALDTSGTHDNGPSPECPESPHPTARELPGHGATAAPQTPSPHSSPPPTTRPACPLEAHSSHRDARPFARGRRCGRPPRAWLTPWSWPALIGSVCPHASAHRTDGPSPAGWYASTSDTSRYTAPPWRAPADHRCRWGHLRARGHAWSHRHRGRPTDAIAIRSPRVAAAECRSLDAETARDRRRIKAPGSRDTAGASGPRPHRLCLPG